MSNANNWKPVLPKGDGQATFNDWITEGKVMSDECQCGADKVYKNEENSKYWHSYWCPKYQPDPAREEALRKKWLK